MKQENKRQIRIGIPPSESASPHFLSFHTRNIPVNQGINELTKKEDTYYYIPKLGTKKPEDQNILLPYNFHSVYVEPLRSTYGIPTEYGCRIGFWEINHDLARFRNNHPESPESLRRKFSILLHAQDLDYSYLDNLISSLAHNFGEKKALAELFEKNIPTITIRSDKFIMFGLTDTPFYTISPNHNQVNKVAIFDRQPPEYNPDEHPLPYTHKAEGMGHEFDLSYSFTYKQREFTFQAGMDAHIAVTSDEFMDKALKIVDQARAGDLAAIDVSPLRECVDLHVEDVSVREIPIK